MRSAVKWAAGSCNGPSRVVPSPAILLLPWGSASRPSCDMREGRREREREGEGERERERERETLGWQSSLGGTTISLCSWPAHRAMLTEKFSLSRPTLCVPPGGLPVGYRVVHTVAVDAVGAIRLCSVQGSRLSLGQLVHSCAAEGGKLLLGELWRSCLHHSDLMMECKLLGLGRTRPGPCTLSCSRSTTKAALPALQRPADACKICEHLLIAWQSACPRPDWSAHFLSETSSILLPCQHHITACASARQQVCLTEQCTTTATRHQPSGRSGPCSEASQ